MDKPWKTETSPYTGRTRLINSNGNRIGDVFDKDKANEIIHCVNTHAALVSALEDTLKLLERKAVTTNDFWEMIEMRKIILPKAKAALAAAKGEK